MHSNWGSGSEAVIRGKVARNPLIDPVRASMF